MQNSVVSFLRKLGFRVNGAAPKRLLIPLLVFAVAAEASADPLSKRTDIDFFRDVPSRNLKGLATRSDGRLVSGPTLTEIAAPAPAELLWCLDPTSDPHKFLLGTGPEGRVVEVTFNATDSAYTARDLAKLDDPQVFAVKALADGSVLAGTSPKGALYLIRDGKTVSRVLLPVDSIFDLLAIDDHTVLAATGNPGRIYRIDVRKFASAGISPAKISDPKELADRGITLFGEIRDRNVRRLAAFPDGRIVAGSSPRGNIYTFPAAGGAPFILQENHEAEVTDLLPQPNGDLYASIVFSTSSGESRVAPHGTDSNPPAKTHEDAGSATAPVPADRFAGRSTVVWFPANGYPETLTSRGGVAFYRLLRHDNTLVIAGGDTGDLLGFDLKARFSLTYAGSTSAQLNGIAPLTGSPGRFVVLRNNVPGLALLDFNAAGPREAVTRRIDLGLPSLLGAVRFNRLRNLTGSQLSLEARVSNGSDEVEGWGPWTPLKLDPDGGWRAANLRGRYARIRISVAGQSGQAGAELDRAALFSLPQDRRPQLQDFRVLSPGFGLVVVPDQTPSPIVTLNQLLQPSSHDDDKHKNAFMSSQVIPQPGAQVVLWTMVDPDGDNFTTTFSIRRDGDKVWTDVVANTHDQYVQFDTTYLPDGVYFTRLVAKETAPRPAAERLSQTFETDDLVIDHTPPAILDATARRVGDSVVVTMHGRDALSLLDNMDVTFNNNVHETVEQPVDGIRDGREETFELEVPLARVSNATSVEVTLYDAAGNGATRRLTW
ncbi:MAG TPA: hypothetical protein VHE61_13920 [Opitutaceae bacterium]|nr:hypothetical protein [Opitutaceae bacterium]